MKNNTTPKCFGSQARSLLHGDSAEECLDCRLFEQCHKITVAASLQAMSDDLDLLVQNGLVDGRLKGFEELDKLAEADDERRRKP